MEKTMCDFDDVQCDDVDGPDMTGLSSCWTLNKKAPADITCPSPWDE